MILEAFMMERLGLGARPPRWKAGRGPRAQACSRSKLLRPVECLKSSEAPQRRAAKVMAGQCLQWAFGMLWMLSQTGRALMAPEKKDALGGWACRLQPVSLARCIERSHDP